MIAKFLWNTYKDKFIQYHIEERNNNNYDFSQLEYRFTDSDGKKYYGYNDKLTMSFDRFSQLNDYHIWWSNGLTERELHVLLDVAEKALENGIVKLEKGQRTNVLTISAVLNEIRLRKDMIKHTELIYNILAVQLVREDENPLLFNNDIHLKKVDQFKKEVLNNNCFFLSMNEFKMLFNYVTMSEQEYQNYVKESKEQAKKNLEVITFLESRK